MIRRIALILALLFCPLARANYVNSGVSGSGNFANLASFTCVPNTSVTSGNTEYMFLQYNSVNTYTISSTRVPTWIQDRFDNGTGDTTVLLHGAVTSTGAETITVTTSGSQQGGLMCGEYTQGSNISRTAGASNTLTIPADSGVDIVTGGSACCASITLQAPFTTRQTLSLGGTIFCAFGDFHTSGSGNQTITYTNGSGAYADTTCTSNGCNPAKTRPQVIKENLDAPRNPIIITARAALRGPRPDYRIRDGR